MEFRYIAQVVALAALSSACQGEVNGHRTGTLPTEATDCAGVPGGTAELDGCGDCAGGDTGKAACAADCAGEPGGAAFVDECGACVGGGTGRKACVKDCNGEFGGTARLDECGQCTGGRTEKEPCTQDCIGEFGGLAFLDACNECVGGSTGKRACEQDCAAQYGGSAHTDECGHCVGGSTGNTACEKDCHGDFGGLADVDACGACVGGNTGLIACSADCAGDLGGSAFVDDCGACVGGNTGKTACERDCAGSFGGVAKLDECGQCAGGASGRPACTQDCNGDWGGSALLDECNVCSGGKTGKSACTQDCNGDWGGQAVVDECKVCSGGNTGKIACTQDCNQQWGGLAASDGCERCAGGNTGITPCTQDCSGVWGGSAEMDGCGRCVGGNTGKTACARDCHGDLGGSAHHDECHVCVEGKTQRTACTKDCAGIWGGTASVDHCGQCSGGSTGKAACKMDCHGDWGGSAALDHCGQCSGGASDHEACTQDCSGEWGGSAFVDTCGQCVDGFGDEPCAPDCHGDWGGGARIDDCGTCAGGKTGVRACERDCNGDWGGSARPDDCGECVEGKTGRVACLPGECKVGQGRHKSIQLTIDDLNCQVILIGAGGFREHLTITRSLTLRGQGMDATILDGERSGRVIDVSAIIQKPTVRIESLSIRNGLAPYGAGISATDADLELSSVDVHDNEAAGASDYNKNGAGIASDHGTLLLQKSLVHENHCESCSGAGVYSRQGSVRLEASSITHNRITKATTTVSGAGMSMAGWRGNGNTLYASDSHIDGNSLVSIAKSESAGGGGLNLDGVEAEFVNCTLSDNRVEAVQLGHAAAFSYALEDGQLALRNTTMAGNVLQNQAPPGIGSIMYINAWGSSAQSNELQVHFDEVSIDQNQVRHETDDPAWTASGLLHVRADNSHVVLNARALHMKGNDVALPKARAKGGLIYFFSDAYQPKGAVGIDAILSESEFSDNQFAAYSVDGLFGASEWSTLSDVHVTLERSLVADNILTSQPNHEPSHLFDAVSGSFVISGSTLHGNILDGGSSSNAYSIGGPLTFVNATVTDNLVRNAQGRVRPLSREVYAYHSVFSGNTGVGTCTPDDLSLISGHHNWFFDPQACERTDDPESTVGEDPQLDALADNGGPTRSRRPRSSSPLIDAGDATCSNGSSVSSFFDQRGTRRPQGASCDIGSVEAR
jgi:hypothetical protein